MPENLNLSVGNIDTSSRKFNPHGLTEKQETARRSTNLRPDTLAGVLDWLSKTIKDQELLKELQKAAKSYPNQALGQFKKNVPNLVKSIYKKRRKKHSTKDETNEPSSEPTPE